jgi:hypothetical protein
MPKYRISLGFPEWHVPIQTSCMVMSTTDQGEGFLTAVPRYLMGTARLADGLIDQMISYDHITGFRQYRPPPPTQPSNHFQGFLSMQLKTYTLNSGLLNIL